MGVTLQEMLAELSDEVPGCRHTSVIDGRTGLALAAVSETDPLDAAGADAYHSDLYRLGRTALEEMPLSGPTEEVVITGGTNTFVSIPVEDTGYIWLVVTEQATTVGFIQALMRKHVGRVQESVRELV